MVGPPLFDDAPYKSAIFILITSITKKYINVRSLNNKNIELNSFITTDEILMHSEFRMGNKRVDHFKAVFSKRVQFNEKRNTEAGFPI